MKRKRHQTYAIMSLLLLTCTVVCADFTQFRGPNGNGHISSTRIPLHWSETQNITWKTPIPHRGWSTPVVADGKVWLTTATDDGHDFFAICIDVHSGKILLNKKLFHADNPEPLGNNINCYASPSPTIEPGRVYISFGSYGTACLDTNTYKVIWQRTDLPCRHYRGPGSSLIIYKNLLILTMDGVDVQYLTALDKTTGKTVWKTDRTTQYNDLDDNGLPFMEGDLRKAYSTPLIIDVKGQTQMISCGAKSTYAYNPENGKEIWKVTYEGYSNAAMPVYGNSMVYILTGFGRSELYAIRTDGLGDITDTHIAWKTKRSVPRTPSPLLIDELLFIITDNGILTCLNALTGEEHWQQRLKGNFASSPIYANNHIYCTNQTGRTTIFKPAKEYKEIATNELDTGTMASPAISENALYLRTKTHLYKIEIQKGDNSR